MRLEITTITPVYPRSVFMQWDLTVDPGYSGSCTFEVQKSGSPGGDFETIGLVRDGITYTDTMAGTNNTASLVRSIYYRIRATLPTGMLVTSDAINLDEERAQDVNQQSRKEDVFDGRRRFLIRRKMIRDEQLQFKKFNGVIVAVLKKRHFGTRCTKCYDPVTKLNTRSQCPTCYGTTWIGGYFSPIFTYARFSASGVSSPLTPEGKSDINDNNVTLLNYPHVEEGDIMAEIGGNHRWLVKNVTPTELRRITVHQRIQATELPRTSPEYNINIEGAPPYDPIPSRLPPSL